MESYQPDYLHANPVDVQLHPQASVTNALVGNRVLVAGKAYYKGYVGYVRSVASDIAHVVLDANHRTEMLALDDVIDL